MVRQLRVTAPAYALTPPQIRLSAQQWAQRNLFNGTWNTLLTVATFVPLMLVATRLAQWTAHAHWGVIADHPRFWLIGLMPVGLAARAYWAGGLIAVMVPVTVLLARARVQRPRSAAPGGESSSRSPGSCLRCGWTRLAVST